MTELPIQTLSVTTWSPCFTLWNERNEKRLWKHFLKLNLWLLLLIYPISAILMFSFINGSQICLHFTKGIWWIVQNFAMNLDVNLKKKQSCTLFVVVVVVWKDSPKKLYSRNISTQSAIKSTPRPSEYSKIFWGKWKKRRKILKNTKKRHKKRVGKTI